MKKNVNKLALTACAILSLALLAGCGRTGTAGTQSGPSTTPQSNTAVQSAEPTQNSEPVPNTEPGQSTRPGHSEASSQPEGEFISLEEAKQIVFSQLGVDESALTEQEYDLDRGIYELEFTFDGMEYDYEVDARTGEILKAHSEIDDDRH